MAVRGNTSMAVALLPLVPAAVAVRGTIRKRVAVAVPVPVAVAVLTLTATRTAEDVPEADADAVRGAMCNPTAPPAVLP